GDRGVPRGLLQQPTSARRAGVRLPGGVRTEKPLTPCPLFVGNSNSIEGLRMSGNAKSWMGNLVRSEPPVRAVEPRLDAAAEPEAEKEEDVHPSKAYGGLWSRRHRAFAAEFRFRDSERLDEALDYNFLSRVHWRKGAGEIVLLYERLGVK